MKCCKREPMLAHSNRPNDKYLRDGLYTGNVSSDVGLARETQSQAGLET